MHGQKITDNQVEWDSQQPFVEKDFFSGKTCCQGGEDGKKWAKIKYHIEIMDIYHVVKYQVLAKAEEKKGCNEHILARQLLVKRDRNEIYEPHNR